MARRPWWNALSGRGAGIVTLTPRVKGEPRAKKRRRREASIENTCRLDAKEQGWESRKMNGFGFNSWPDRLFIPPVGPRRGAAFWVEFKRPGEEPTKEQARMHGNLRARGETVYVCDTREKFNDALKKQSAVGRWR